MTARKRSVGETVSRVTLAWRVAALSTILAVGCGSEKLSSGEQHQIAESQADIIIYSVSDRPADRARAEKGIREIVAVARDKPGVKVDKRTIEQMMQDLASTIDDVDRDLAAELDRAAGS